jgi:hypothetical protein
MPTLFNAVIFHWRTEPTKDQVRADTVTQAKHKLRIAHPNAKEIQLDTPDGIRTFRTWRRRRRDH